MTGHPRRWPILAAMCLSLLIVVIDNTILNVALPTLARELAAGTTELQWITDAYTLVFAALLIPAGFLGDRFGHRRALMGGLAVFLIGSVLAAVADDSARLIAARAVMGAGGAFVMPATLAIITAVFPTSERARAIGLWSATAGIGIVVGPTLGGFLLGHFAWGAVFWVNVPLVALALTAVLAIVTGLPSRRGTAGRLDVAGAVLAAGGTLALVDAVIGGPERGWLSATTLGELALAGLLLTGFVAWELRAASPLIDLRVFTYRAFSAATLSVALIFFALFGSLFALTQYLQLVQGYSPLGAGLRALPFAAAVLVLAPLSSVLVVRWGIRVVIPAGLTLMGSGLLLLAAQVTPTTNYAFLAVAVTVMGAGMGLVIAPASESIMSVLPTGQVGAGSAINSTVQELGGTLGVAVIGSLVSASYRANMDGSALPDALLTSARGSIGSADAVAASVPDAVQVTGIADQAFTVAMATGFGVAGGVALVGAVGVAIALPRLRRDAGDAAPVTVADAASDLPMGI